MPGLIRAVGRTAVIAGTATHVSNNVSRRQQAKWANQEGQQQAAAAPPPPAPAAGGDDMLDQLKQLGELKQAGVLTEAEFEAQKAKILAPAETAQIERVHERRPHPPAAAARRVSRRSPGSRCAGQRSSRRARPDRR